MKILPSKRHWTVNSSHCRRHYFVIEIWGKMTTFSPKWFHSRTDKRKLWISWGILLIVVPNRNFETLRVLFWMLFKILRRIFKLIILFLLPSWNSNRRFKFSPLTSYHNNNIYHTNFQPIGKLLCTSNLLYFLPKVSSVTGMV